MKVVLSQDSRIFLHYIKGRHIVRMEENVILKSAKYPHGATWLDFLLPAPQPSRNKIGSRAGILLFEKKSIALLGYFNLWDGKGWRGVDITAQPLLSYMWNSYGAIKPLEIFHSNKFLTRKVLRPSLVNNAKNSLVQLFHFINPTCISFKAVVDSKKR